MRRLALFAAFLVCTSAAQAAASLQVFVSTSPGSVVQGSNVTVEILVKNNGDQQANDVVTTAVPVDPYAGAAGGVTLVAEPDPATIPAVLLAGASVTYTWIYQGTACGDAGFSASATGTEEGSGNPLAAPQQVAGIVVLCPTATPTPTPWIIYATPTPPPSRADARTRGNVLRPGSASVEFDLDLPEASKLVIRIFDRNGASVRTIERDLAAGRHLEFWDGRTDGGNLAAAGIYIVHFRANGLNKSAKLAVIK